MANQTVYFSSLQGKRPTNEDAHEIIINIDSKDSKKAPVNFFSIYDGHGGSNVSKFIGTNVGKIFTDKRLQYPLNKRNVNTIFNALQTKLKSLEYSKYSGSCALIAVQFKYKNEQYVNIINLGDSRAILCRANLAISLSADHKPNWPVERHRIMKLGGKITWDGYDHRIKDLSVSRAFGDVDATPFVTHEPDLYRYKIDSNDRFLLLVCDGAVEKLENQDLVNFILTNCYDNKLEKRIKKNINIAKLVAEQAIKSGSGDNVSVIVVFFD